MIKIGLYIILLLGFINPNNIHAQSIFETPKKWIYVNTQDWKDPSNTLFVTDTHKIANQVNHAISLIFSNSDSALYLFQKSLRESESLHYKTGIASSLSNMGYMHSLFGNYALSLYYFRKAEPFVINGLHQRTSIGMFYSSFTLPFYRLTLFDSVFFYANKAEGIIKDYVCKTNWELNDVSSIYNNLSVLWNTMGNEKKSKYYLLKSLETIDKAKSKSKQLIISQELIYNNLSAMYLREDQLDSARYYIDIALLLNPQNALTLVNYGDMKLYEKDTFATLNIYKKAILKAQQARDISNELVSTSRLGFIYFDCKLYDIAQKYLLNVLQITDNIGDIDLEIQYKTLHKLATISSLDNDYEKAYQFEHRSLVVLDSMQSDEKRKAVYALESEINQATVDQQNTFNQLLISKSQNELTKKNFWITLIISITIFLGIATLLLSKKYKQKEKRQLQNLEDFKKDNEIEQLKSSIKGEEIERARMAREIHDGIMVQFSTIKMNMKRVPDDIKLLNSKDYIHSEYYQQLIQQMENATRELRYTAHNLMPDFLLESGLEDALSYFCNNLQTNTQLNIDLQIIGKLPSLDKNTELSIYRIIQELLQNIIKHAQAKHVIIQIVSLDDKQLSITVEDDGKGFDLHLSSKGMGLSNIRNRVKIMKGHLDIQSQIDNGTSVHIEL